MEITRESAETMIEERFREYPRMGAVAKNPNFKAILQQILDFEKLDASYFPDIENEVLIVLTLYSPLTELAQNIQESTGLSSEISGRITTLISTLILEPVYDDLTAYAYLWNEELAKTTLIPEADKNLKERLSLRPEGVSVQPSEGVAPGAGPKPLTREEVMQTLAPHRTMASDIESLRQKKEGGPVLGYGAFRNTTSTTPPEKSE